MASIRIKYSAVLVGGNDSVCEIARGDAVLPCRRQNRDEEEEAHTDGRREGVIGEHTPTLFQLRHPGNNL